MKYEYRSDIKDNDALRESFNELTRKTFGFDFVGWYESGHWGNQYIPHALVDNKKVISNVSVNLIDFDMGGDLKHYIQLGTVMTDPDYRGQGLNRYLIEKILEEYKEKVDGFYLFANDSVFNYYPKFGFQPSEEYEYWLKQDCRTDQTSDRYIIEKVDMSDSEKCEKLYHTIREYDKLNLWHNPNNAFAMFGNLSLIQFWLAAEYENNVYYLPELEAYVIAHIDAGILTIVEIFSNKKVEITKFATSFGQDVDEVKLCYTPSEKEAYRVEIHPDECTLFIMGEGLEKIEEEKMMFPVISHA